MSVDETFNRFHRLIKKGDLVAIRELLASGVDVNIRNRFGWTILMLAAIEGNTPIINFLFSKGAEVQAVNDFGVSALAYTALQGKCRAIRALLDAGASLDVRPHGWSLLQFASVGAGAMKTQKHFEMLRAAGANE